MEMLSSFKGAVKLFIEAFSTIILCFCLASRLLIYMKRYAIEFMRKFS